MDAARIDGCGELGIWARIMLPLSKPALAVVALFTFIGAWNDFLGPLIYLMDQKRYTLSIGLASNLFTSIFVSKTFFEMELAQRTQATSLSI